VALLLALWLASTSLFAQTVPIVPRSAVEKKLQNEIICMCSCRRPLNECGMLNCGGREPETARIRELLENGKTHDEVIAAFIQQYGGQDILSAPLDQGFNRLAWLFPYLVGVSSAVGVAFVAVRWSRQPKPAPETLASADPATEDRLDDELRNLD
jgi:hypothetical protein